MYVILKDDEFFI